MFNLFVSLIARSCDPARQLKVLTKKLRQLEELKLKQENGTILNEDQKEKLKQEQILIEQIEALKIKM
jgi:hypothetical protein